MVWLEAALTMTEIKLSFLLPRRNINDVDSRLRGNDRRGRKTALQNDGSLDYLLFEVLAAATILALTFLAFTRFLRMTSRWLYFISSPLSVLILVLNFPPILRPAPSYPQAGRENPFLRVD